MRVDNLHPLRATLRLRHLLPIHPLRSAARLDCRIDPNDFRLPQDPPLPHRRLSPRDGYVNLFLLD